MRLNRALNPTLKNFMQLTVENIYSDFLNVVSTGRNLDTRFVNQIGQGRVWTGLQAKDHGLVDNIGFLADAIASAAQQAGLGNSYQEEYITLEATPLELLMGGPGVGTSWLPASVNDSPWYQLVLLALGQSRQLADIPLPQNGVYAQCLACDIQ